MAGEISRAEFIQKHIQGDLLKWMGGREYDRTLASWLYSVEEWACQRQGELRREERNA